MKLYFSTEIDEPQYYRKIHPLQQKKPDRPQNENHPAFFYINFKSLHFNKVLTSIHVKEQPIANSFLNYQHRIPITKEPILLFDRLLISIHD